MWYAGWGFIVKWMRDGNVFSEGQGVLINVLSIVGIESQWFVLCLTVLGGLIFAFGVRVQQFGLRLLGLLLQIIALYLFLDTVWYPFSAIILKNSYFFLCFCIAFTALFSAYIVERWLVGGMKRWDSVLSFVLFFLAVTAWYVAGVREVYVHIVLAERLNGLLLFVSVTSIFVGLLAENRLWKKLNVLLLMQLPAMVLLLLFEHRRGPGDYSLLTGWGTTVWPITFFVQYRVLQVLDDLNWRRVSSIYHLLSLWLLFFFCNREIGVVGAGVDQASPLIIQFRQTFLGCAAIVFLVVIKQKNLWPVRLFPAVYLWGGAVGFIVIFLLSNAGLL